MRKIRLAMQLFLVITTFRKYITERSRMAGEIQSHQGNTIFQLAFIHQQAFRLVRAPVIEEAISTASEHSFLISQGDQLADEPDHPLPFIGIELFPTYRP